MFFRIMYRRKILVWDDQLEKVCHINIDALDFGDLGFQNNHIRGHSVGRMAIVCCGNERFELEPNIIIVTRNSNKF